MDPKPDKAQNLETGVPDPPLGKNMNGEQILTHPNCFVPLAVLFTTATALSRLCEA